MTKKRIIAVPDSAEDHLPDGQPVIKTKGVKRLGRFMELVTNSRTRTGYSTMGVVYGKAGRGKTIAIQAHVDQFDLRSYTGLPPVIKVKVKPDSTPKALAQDILASLEEKPRGRNRYELADEVAEAINRNDINLIVIDEADRLNEASFDLLRHIHDKTGCPIVLVGLQYILTVILRQEKFASRVGLKMRFPSCSKHEILNVVLPALVFPCWKYNPDNEQDIEIGERIYEMVGPSLRKLRNVLDIASQIAELDGESRITVETLEEAFDWTPFDGSADTVTKGEEEDEDPQRGELEHSSETRHDANNGKRQVLNGM